MGDELLHLAVALDGTGFHPASWREPSARPSELFESQYWIDLARTAERGLLDFLTIEDAFGIQSSKWAGPDERRDQVRGRLDAVLIASLVAPVTSRIGLVPTAVTTHTEPFHLASAFSTLDHISNGRAGWRPQVSWRTSEAAHVGSGGVAAVLPGDDPDRADRRRGRRAFPAADPADAGDAATPDVVRELFDEAADSVEVVRRLWDSWEDDAEIRDVDTGRFIDRDKLHYVDFEGEFFTVKGPSIVPRPPQGQPIVAALAHSKVPFEFAARSADVVFVTPADRDAVPTWVADVHAAEAAVARTGAPLKIFGEFVVVLDDTTAAAEARQVRLDELDGSRFRSDAPIFAGTPDDLVAELLEWRRLGLDGFRLRPAVIGHDLDAVVDRVVPALQRAGAFRTTYDDGFLRERLGLSRPASRYAADSTGGGR